MNAAPVFDRVYSRLKQMLRDNEIGPAQRLDPAALSDTLVASITPVRDALHRLAGERLVAFTQDGFQVPLLSEPDLRDLYVWNYQFLLLALRMMPPAHAARPSLPADDVPNAVATERFFAAIVRATGNRELAFTIDALNDRLHPARQAEEQVLSGIAEELTELDGAGLRELRGLTGRYHRRRIAAVPEIVRALYRN